MDTAFIQMLADDASGRYDVRALAKIVLVLHARVTALEASRPAVKS